MTKGLVNQPLGLTQEFGVISVKCSPRLRFRILIFCFISCVCFFFALFFFFCKGKHFPLHHLFHTHTYAFYTISRVHHHPPHFALFFVSFFLLTSSIF